MPLEIYQRGRTWWLKGSVDGLDGYIRRSLGTSDRAIAEIKAGSIEREARERAVLGDRAPKPSEKLTFAGAILLCNPGTADAGYLKKVLPHMGNRKLVDITPAEIRDLGHRIYPTASCDTWQRQIVTPVRAVINRAHDLGKGPALRIKGYSKQERQEQDRKRGILSRQEKTPGSWPWVLSFRIEANPYLSALALFMFTTGARVSQSLEIRPLDLDLQNGRLWLPGAKGHPAQWVSIVPETVVDIANLTPRHGRVFGYTTRQAVYGPWRTACKRADIEYLPPHSSGRHGFGTETIVRQGVDPVTVAEAGRWSDPSLLLKTYAHGEDTDAKIQAALRAGLQQTSPVSIAGNQKKSSK